MCVPRAGDVAEERLPRAHGERARVRHAERRAGDRAAAASRRSRLPLQGGAAALSAHIQVTNRTLTHAHTTSSLVTEQSGSSH